MTVNVTKPAINVREKLAEVDKPTGLAGEAMLRAETPQEQFQLINAGRRNLIINGDMRIAQRSTSTSTSSTGYSTVDRWSHNVSLPAGVFAVTYSQSTDAPSGFGSSFKAVPDQSATSALLGGNRLLLLQTIEAQDLQQLGFGSSNAKSFTLSFWIKSNLTGTVTIELESPDSSSSYYFYTDTITINTSGVWEYKTITIQPNTNGNINNDNGVGLLVAFWLAAGPDFTSGGNPYNGTWHTTTNSTRADPSNINIYSSNSNYVNITGVQLEVGKVATPFEHRSYAEELALCQRYAYVTSGSVGNGGVAIGSTQPHIHITYPVIMRTSPTVSLNTPGSFRISDDYVADIETSSVSINTSLSNATKARVRLDGFSGLTVGRFYAPDGLASSTAKILFDAEL